MSYPGIHILLRNDGTKKETTEERTGLRNQLVKKKIMVDKLKDA